MAVPALDALNLDGLGIEDMETVTKALGLLHRYSERKLVAMTLRQRGDVNGALAAEAECERLYGLLPESWRW